MKRTKTTIPVKCEICDHTSKDSSAHSAHLNRKHSIKSNDEKISYLLKYDTENNYYCETDDGKLKEFKRAVLSQLPFDDKCYNLSKEKYSLIKKLCGKFPNFRSMADYLYLELKLTENEITSEIINKHKPKFSSVSLEFFLKKTGGDVVKAKELQTKRQTTTSKKSFIERYGEEAGKKKYDEHFKNIHSKVKGQSYNTLESFIEKYGEEDGTKKFKKAKALGAPTLANFIRCHGEEAGPEKHASWIKKMGRTLENFQRKYGIEEGKVRYKNYRSKFGGAMGKASKESLTIFNPIAEYLINLGYEDDLYYGVDGKKEYFLYDKKTDNYYLFDFTIRSAKIIIEYNGLAYHPYKERLTENEWKQWKEPYSKMSAEDKFEKDQGKIKFAEKQGFKVLEIWSDASVDENINISKNFIKENLTMC